MRLYYFNVLDGEHEEIDVVGKACPDDVAALSEAFRVASDVLQRRLIYDSCSAAGVVEVESEDHQLLFSMPVSAATY
jgi:acid stress-induced BolA-like protein IbaG/YrbA